MNMFARADTRMFKQDVPFVVAERRTHQCASPDIVARILRRTLKIRDSHPSTPASLVTGQGSWAVRSPQWEATVSSLKAGPSLFRLGERSPSEIVLPPVYPVTVPVDSPVLRGLVPSTSYDNTRRSRQLPCLYEYPLPHPSHRVKFPGSRTFVYLVDPSPENKAITDALFMSQGIPSGSSQDIPWLVDVLPGDAVMARPIDRGGDPEYDCLQALFGATLKREPTPNMQQMLAGSKYTQADVIARIDAFEEARDALLGPRALRVKNRGKAAFEMDPRAEPVSNGPRCYPFNSMVQRTRQVEGPPATLKTLNNTPDDYQRNVQRYDEASTALNVLAWELQGPLNLLKVTREYGDHINSPRLGHHDNYYWFPQQCNIAGAKHPSEVHKFIDDQGFFSGVHRDKGDAANGHSVGLAGSDLSAAAEPGRFHLVGQGVYFRLMYMAQIFFTGLLPHGGTPPLVPEDVEIEGWETRMFLISYPASSMLNGEARHPFASLPYEEFPLYIPPEATGAPHNTRDQPFWTNHATYAQDGWLLFWTLKQVPAEYGVEVDCDLITSSVTYLQDGKRVSADRWEFAPNADVQNPFGELHKNIQDAFLKREYDRLMQGIPGVVVNKYRDWDVTTGSFGGRSKGSKRSRTTTSAGSSETDNIGQPPQKKTRLATIVENTTRETVNNAFPMVATSLRSLRRFAVPAPAAVSSPVPGDVEVLEPNACPSSPPSPSSSDQGLVAATPVASLRLDHRFSADNASEASSIRNTEDTEPNVSASLPSPPSSSDQGLVVAAPVASLRLNHRLSANNASEALHIRNTEDTQPLPSSSRVSIVPSCLPTSNVDNRTMSAAMLQRLNFIRSLIDEIVPAAHEDVKHVVVEATSNEYLKNALKTLDSLSTSLDPLSTTFHMSEAELVSCSESLQAVKQHCHASSQWINLYRQHVMIFEAHMVASIRHLVDEQCPHILRNLASFAGDKSRCSWLVRLTTKVMALVRSGMAITANSQDYFKPDVLEPRKFWEDPAAVLHRKNLPLAKVEATVLAYMRRILYAWFGSKTPFTTQAQSALVRWLVNRLGEGCLLLPSIWKIYVDVPQWLFTEECPRVGTGDKSLTTVFESRYLDALSAVVGQLDPDNTLPRSLSQLQLSYDELHTRVHEHANSILVARTKKAMIKRLLTTLSKSATLVTPPAPPAPFSPSAPSASPTPLTSPALPAPLTSLSPPNLSTPSTPPAPPAHHLSSVIRFLEDSLLVIQTLRKLRPRAELTSAQQFVFSKPDFLLPLREEATSRFIMNQRLGEAFARTRAGFFSLQVFRFIHFNSAAFDKCPDNRRQVEFSSAEEYAQYLGNLKLHFPQEPDCFFCDPKAFGQHIKERTSSRFVDYWRASQSEKYKWPPSRNFTRAWEEMKTFKKEMKKAGDPVWKGVGDLSMYMLIADMYYANLVDAPSPQDVALAISTIRKGGMFGLETLGYITDRTSKIAIENGFVKFYEDITQSLSEEQRILFKWNPIVAEHTLCKFSRAYRAGHYRS
ncbi:hypothetical protein BDY19DRAFT_910432 [Irpex rosettiformis]|uniref:Uncharacterized protein n=1 Tax=Irpex rosettiformis TaxID=378272 RepID=A0ACB8TNS6_9APHY|nr:hypothetical protein BDY19DRAFT_910432 [Irpex rosettiformis]